MGTRSLKAKERLVVSTRPSGKKEESFLDTTGEAPRSCDLDPRLGFFDLVQALRYKIVQGLRYEIVMVR